jgi:hypothetical protein
MVHLEGYDEYEREVRETTNSELYQATKDQKDLINVLRTLGKVSGNADIYYEYNKQHPGNDRVNDRKARIRNVLQRNCETSKQFQGKDKIFTSPSRGCWWLTPAYQRLPT